MFAVQNVFHTPNLKARFSHISLLYTLWNANTTIWSGKISGGVYMSPVSQLIQYMVCLLDESTLDRKTQ